MTSPSQLLNNTNVQPFRFSGKELDRSYSQSMYDFGARWYDVAGVPMWTSMDPLAEDNYSVTPYSYCNGDPVNRIDPDGRKIQILNQESRNVLLSYINSISSKKFAYNEKGYLYNTGKESEEGKSKLYTQRINDAINKDNLTIVIEIDDSYTNNGVMYPLSHKGEGATWTVDNNTVGVIISGKEHKTKDQKDATLIQSPAEILMHELVGHAIPTISPSNSFDTGNAIDNENLIRKEIGLPMRKEDKKHVE